MFVYNGAAAVAQLKSTQRGRSMQARNSSGKLGDLVTWTSFKLPRGAEVCPVQLQASQLEEIARSSIKRTRGS